MFLGLQSHHSTLKSAVLGAIVLLCTLYDYFLCQDQSK